MGRLLRSLGLVLALMCAAAPAVSAPPAKGTPVPDQYLVAVKKTGPLGGVLSADKLAEIGKELAGKHGGKLLLTYGHAFNGYLATLTASQAEALRKDPLVKYVEQDTFVGFARIQQKPVWNLDRVDQRSPKLDSTYRYPDSAGDRVHIYIIDTGIRGTHEDFKNRYGGGVNFAARNPAAARAEDIGDCNGHGTHVAGIAAGERYGVAKRARVYAVRVLDCEGSGTMSAVIAGVDWVASKARRPAVANLSLGGGASQALDDAIDKLIDRGVVTVVAAGNDNRDACDASPARVKDAITVAATDSKDQRASFSNYGKCVDLFAPGTDIRSTWFEKDNQHATLSGTSMAAPHVAGIAALYLGDDRDARESRISADLVRDSSDDRVKDPRGSPNRLAYSGNTAPDEDYAPPMQREPQPRQGSPLPQIPIR